MSLLQKLRGTGVAIVTPFNVKNEVDVTSLEKIVNHLVKNKVEYIVALGTTGESVNLTKDEKKLVVSTIIKTVKNKIPVVLGLGGNNTAEILETIDHTDFKGISAILSVSPYYNKPTQDGIIAHYEMVAGKSPVPVILYNVPGRTGSNMLWKTTIHLANHPNIIAIKEASGNMEQVMKIIKNKPKNFMVISGDDNLTLPMIACGAEGVISVVANAYAKDYSDMVRASLAGDFVKARKLHYPLIDITDALFVDGNPGGIKALLNLMGLCENEVRLPLVPVNESTFNLLKSLKK